MADKKSLDDMRDEAYRRQDNLASDIDELIDRVNPKNAVTRWKNELVGSVKGFSAAGDGKSDSTLPVVVGGVIGAFITFTVIAGMSALGPARAVMLIVSSQVIVAYIIEVFGIFGVEKAGFDWTKLLGTALFVAGIVIFKMKG